MAAAALSRSRGVAGVRTTKGLFFIFSLLCLVCLASSLVDKEKLGKHKEDLQKAEQRLESLKAQDAFLSEFMSEFLNFLETQTASAKKISEGLSGDFTPVEEFLQSLKDTIEKIETDVDEQSEGLDVKIERLERDLGKRRKLINFLEEYQAEL